MSKIRVFALGGLNENGKNMYVVEVGSKIFVFDAGLKYDNDNNLGIDYIIPNISYLIKNKKNIVGIFLTHGHESNMGAMPDIMKMLPNVPVYGTRLTLEILKEDLDSKTLKNSKLVLIEKEKEIKFGDESILPLSVTHSIPDAVMYVLKTKDGSIVYTGDYVFDMSVPDIYKTDLGALADVGKKGVLLLMSESIYAEKRGHTSPQNRVEDFIRDVFRKSDGRIIATIFPAHFYRIQEIFNEAMKTNKKIVIMGKKLQTTIFNAVKAGYLTVDRKFIGSLDNLNDKNAIILISDAKERPFANLERIIKGYDKFITINEDDTIFITEPSYAGIEKKIAEVMDEVAIKGADAISLSPKTHLLFHSSREDLMQMIELMHPKYYMPVKGEYKALYENALVAESYGINKDNIILKLNGDVAEFEDGTYNKDCFDKVEVGDTLFDGKNIEDMSSLVLKDREMIGENGIVIIAATLDKKTKEIIGGPEILTRGFIYVRNNQALLEEATKMSKETIESNIVKGEVRVDYTKIKNDVRDKLGKFFFDKTGSKPMIITVIQEV